jgi:hypothetical protein
MVERLMEKTKGGKWEYALGSRFSFRGDSGRFEAENPTVFEQITSQFSRPVLDVQEKSNAATLSRM